VTEIVGDVDGKIAVVVDDMISTGGTLAKAAEALISRGATKVYTCATHGIFAGDAVRVLNESPIERDHRDEHDPQFEPSSDRSSRCSRSPRSSPTRSSASRRIARSPSSSRRMRTAHRDTPEARIRRPTRPRAHARDASPAKIC
jgi:hypothetical protein